MKRAICAAAMLVAAAFASGAAHARADMAAQNYLYHADRSQTFDRSVRRARRAVVRNIQPRQVLRNTEAVIKAPLGALDGAARWFKLNLHRNPTGWRCLWCGRSMRLANIASGYKDCAGGDHVNGWLSPACSTQAPAGAINSMRITRRHISKVIGTCPRGVLTISGNSVGGTTSIVCEPLHGAHYRYPIPASGPVKVYYMQPDPCGGYGPRRARRRT